MSYQEEAEQRGKEAHDHLSTFINGASSHAEKGFVDQAIEGYIQGIKTDHRTLQQKTVKLFLQTIEAFAEIPDNRTDLRNESAVKVSRELIEAFKKTHGGNKPSQYLPLI